MRFARIRALLQACSALPCTSLHAVAAPSRPASARVWTTSRRRAARMPFPARDGTLPQWLAGAVVRNGPGRFTTAKQNCSHLFDGMALLSRFEVDGATNSVKWASRYLQSKAYEYARHENNGLLYNEFGTAAGVGLAGEGRLVDAGRRERRDDGQRVRVGRADF